MNITPVTRTVIDYACTFSAEDVQLARSDPYSFGEKFREQLLALDPKPEPNGKHPNRVHLTLSRKSSGRKAAKPASPKGSKPLLDCPFRCGRTFKHQKRLDTHVATQHSTSSASVEDAR